ncbi:MAG: acs [Gemmatimonadetes bacterium]|nr:acs [Gemmatimonadota bacterium]
MLRGIWGDEERFREIYWSKWAGKTVGDDAQPGESVYFPGDGAKRDERGNFWVIAASTTC